MLEILKIHAMDIDVRSNASTPVSFRSTTSFNDTQIKSLDDAQQNIHATMSVLSRDFITLKDQVKQLYKHVKQKDKGSKSTLDITLFQKQIEANIERLSKQYAALNDSFELQKKTLTELTTRVEQESDSIKVELGKVKSEWATYFDKTETRITNFLAHTKGVVENLAIQIEQLKVAGNQKNKKNDSEKSKYFDLVEQYYLKMEAMSNKFEQSFDQYRAEIRKWNELKSHVSDLTTKLNVLEKKLETTEAKMDQALKMLAEEREERKKADEEMKKIKQLLLRSHSLPHSPSKQASPKLEIYGLETPKGPRRLSHTSGSPKTEA